MAAIMSTPSSSTSNSINNKAAAATSVHVSPGKRPRSPATITAQHGAASPSKTASSPSMRETPQFFPSGSSRGVAGTSNMNVQRLAAAHSRHKSLDGLASAAMAAAAASSFTLQPSLMENESSSNAGSPSSAGPIRSGAAGLVSYGSDDPFTAPAPLQSATDNVAAALNAAADRQSPPSSAIGTLSSARSGDSGVSSRIFSPADSTTSSYNGTMASSMHSSDNASPMKRSGAVPQPPLSASAQSQLPGHHVHHHQQQQQQQQHQHQQQLHSPPSAVARSTPKTSPKSALSHAYHPDVTAFAQTSGTHSSNQPYQTSGTLSSPTLAYLNFAASPQLSSQPVQGGPGGYSPVAALNAGPANYTQPTAAPGYSQPPPQISGLRRSIAGHSSIGGSSYHSGNSMSPYASDGRRSDDMPPETPMYSTANTSLASSTGPTAGPSMSPYAGMMADMTMSPSTNKHQWSSANVLSSPSVPQVAQYSQPHQYAYQAQQSAGVATYAQPAGSPGIGHAPPGNVHTYTAGQYAPPQSVNATSMASPIVHDPMYGHVPQASRGHEAPPRPYQGQTQQPPPTQYGDYQSIVDEIMAQSRKGSDFGLELGDFEMLDTLGTGTFGRVLLVRLAPKSVGGFNALSQFPSGMSHYFAMKVLTKSEVVRLKQVEHINCERSILGAVEHPGIVNLFCTFQDSLNIYMLLEFVQGGELFSHLRRAVRFSADVSRFYAANIILVLEYLHNRNLIYRDLKPENLLLDHQGYLKVTDFGFAKYVPDRTFTLCGTPEYLAPEIINSAGHGKAADWWAFGVLLFEMLCGYPPFFDESPWGIYEKILAGTFAFPPHVDPVARDLIRRLLSADRSKRLGNLRNGALDVRNHKWFEGVDWLAVERRLIPAPIIPRIKSTGDSQNFERYPSIPIESLPGLARAQGHPVKESIDPYESLFTSF